MSPEEVLAEWVELAARALYKARSHGDDEAWDEVHANVQDGTREWARAALAAVLPHYGARVLNEAREALAGKVLWGEHRSGYSGALVRLDGVPATAGTNGSIPLDHWLMHRAAREGGQPVMRPEERKQNDMTETTTAVTRTDYTLQLIADLHAAYGKRVELDITDQGGARWLTLSHSTPTDGTHGLAVGFWGDGTHTMASDGARVELNEATKRDPLAVLVAVRVFLHKYGRGSR